MSFCATSLLEKHKKLKRWATQVTRIALVGTAMLICFFGYEAFAQNYIFVYSVS
jgi:hypothetical protein